MTKSTRRGFTMIELLVVGAIIVLGMALVTPAVQRANVQARRAKCKNNLKQFGIALHNYHETYGTFPLAWAAKSWLPHQGPHFGWQSMILPYIEEASLYNQIDFRRRLPAAGEEIYTKQSIKVYRCPSDTTADLNPMRGGYPTSNYSGNFGSDPIPRWVPGRRSKNWPGQMRTPRDGNGIFACNSKIRIRDILDGTSNTVMVGERSVRGGAGIWPGVGDSSYENDQVTDGSHLSRLNQGFRGFSSAHPNGANFLFCDGAVMYVSDDVESRSSNDEQLGVYQKLTNRHDGQPVGDF